MAAAQAEEPHVQEPSQADLAVGPSQADLCLVALLFEFQQGSAG